PISSARVVKPRNSAVEWLRSPARGDSRENGGETLRSPAITTIRSSPTAASTASTAITGAEIGSQMGSMTDYFELRCRSEFSFLRGASLPEDLVDEAARLGYGALALGDRDGVYGAPRFFRAARNAGIRSLVGAEVTLAGGS